MTPWLFWISGGAITLAGLALLHRALLADRPRGRKRCPKCWYDMSGADESPDGYACPECGRTTRSTRRLSKTRRKWRLGALALLVTSSGLGLLLTPTLASTSPVEVLPPAALLLSYGWLDAERQDRAFDRLADRANNLQPWQRRRLGRIYVDRLMQLRAVRYSPRGLPIAQDEVLFPMRGGGFGTVTGSPLIRRGPALLASDVHLMTLGYESLFTLLGPDVAPAIDDLLGILDSPDAAGADRITALSLLARIAPTDERLRDTVFEMLREETPAMASVAFFIGEEIGLDRELAFALDGRPVEERRLIVRLADPNPIQPASYSDWYEGEPLAARRELALITLEAPTVLPGTFGKLQRDVAEWLLDHLFEDQLRRPERVLIAMRKSFSDQARYCGLLLDVKDGRVVVTSEESGWVHVLADADGDQLLALFHLLSRRPAGFSLDLLHELVVRTESHDAQTMMLRRIVDNPRLWPGFEPHLERLLRQDRNADARILAAQFAPRLGVGQGLISTLEHIAETEEDVLVRIAALVAIDECEERDREPEEPGKETGR